MIRIQEILDKVAANNQNADLELIQKAYVFAATAHAGQTRLSGEPYLSHPLAVADTLAEMGLTSLRWLRACCMTPWRTPRPPLRR